jgi:hypothetical protein
MDVAAVKAIAALFRGLPVAKEDADEAAGTSGLGKYFTFFTRLLTRAKSEVKLAGLKVTISQLIPLLFSPTLRGKRQTSLWSHSVIS